MRMLSSLFYVLALWIPSADSITSSPLGTRQISIVYVHVIVVLRLRPGMKAIASDDGIQGEKGLPTDTL